MTSGIHPVPLGPLVDAASLFGDYVTAAGGRVRALVGDPARASARWGERVGRAARPKDPAAARALRERLAASNRALGVSDDVVGRLSHLGETTRAVVTGQQPGVLGGPLMSWYKIEAAIALARDVEERTGTPCVPIFWMGADDADFAEIRELVLVSADHQAIASSLPASAHPVGLRVGDIAADAVGALWHGLAAFAGALPSGDAVARWSSSSLEGAGDLAEVAARVVVAATGGRVAVVDGREPTLRHAAADLVLEFFDDEDEVRRLVRERGKGLEAVGFHAQLALGPDSGVFLVDEGRRLKIPPERRDEARRRIASDPGTVSPGVVLRTLIQDRVFDPVAVVLGPAEIAYRAQMIDLYERFDVPSPVAFPRLFATWVPPGPAEILEATSLAPSTVVTAPRDLVPAAAAAHTGQALEDARERLVSAVESEAERFLVTAAEHVEGSAREKLRKRVEEATRRLVQAADGVQDAGRVRARERWPFLDDVAGLFERNGAPQERYLWMLAPVAFGGDDARDVVARAARAHVSGVLDGSMVHVVYSL